LPPGFSGERRKANGDKRGKTYEFRFSLFAFPASPLPPGFFGERRKANGDKRGKTYEFRFSLLAFRASLLPPGFFGERRKANGDKRGKRSSTATSISTIPLCSLDLTGAVMGVTSQRDGFRNSSDECSKGLWRLVADSAATVGSTARIFHSSAPQPR
jgi:hypothetical protein